MSEEITRLKELKIKFESDAKKLADKIETLNLTIGILEDLEDKSNKILKEGEK